MLELELLAIEREIEAILSKEFINYWDTVRLVNLHMRKLKVQEDIAELEQLAAHIRLLLQHKGAA